MQGAKPCLAREQVGLSGTEVQGLHLALLEGVVTHYLPGTTAHLLPNLGELVTL